MTRNKHKWGELKNEEIWTKFKYISTITLEDSKKLFFFVEYVKKIAADWPLPFLI